MACVSEPRLAIILPTFRYDAAAKQALALAAEVGCDDIRVHIGDNSANPEKHAFLQRLSERSTNVVVTCHPHNIGAEPNWLFLVRAQSAPFICLACDDDSFSRRYFSAGANILSQDPKCSAASGLLLSIAEEPGRDVPSLYTPPERLESDPTLRIARYNNQNAIAYAITRREVIADFADYVEANPLKNAFNDYLLAFHLLAMGTYKLDRSAQAYVYNNDNWHLPEAAFRTSAKFYVSCDLPEAFAYLARLHWAVANAHFFRSRYRAASLPPATANQIAADLFDRLMADFRPELRKNREAASALLKGDRRAEQCLSDLVARPYARNPEIFEQFIQIVAAVSPDLADRYDRFMKETLLDATCSRPPTSRRRLFAMFGR